MNLTSHKSVSHFGRFAAVFAMSAASLLLSGCGNGLAQVSGQVTIDGQPVDGSKGNAFVVVQFVPVGGKGANGAGLADENGRYSVATGSQSGVWPGEYFVTCTVRNERSGGLVPDPKYADAKKSGLKCTVESGRNEFDIPLQSRPKKPPRTGA
jgi:hypothetical protein